MEKHSRRQRGVLTSPISSVYPCFTAALSRETALSDFPHSRQNRLARGVISPQNGHTICNRTSWACGLSLAINVPRSPQAEASRRRREGRYSSIRFHLCGFSAVAIYLGQLNDDRTEPCDSVQHCSHFLSIFNQPSHKIRSCRWRTEQFRPSIAPRLGDHDCRDEQFFSLFQVL